jgi:hypothetical protein
MAGVCMLRFFGHLLGGCAWCSFKKVRQLALFEFVAAG